MSPSSSPRKTRIGLNGFGRIGRSILRILSAAPSDFEVAFINDIEPLDTCAYLFKYDSVFGTFAGQVEAVEGGLSINGTVIPFHGLSDISTLELSDVDVVLECTGMAGKRAVAERGLQAGARNVLISGPSNEADVTIVLGANEEKLVGQKIVSNASCTTNALAPLLKVLDQELGVIGGHMTTVHCYTGSQPTVDKPRANPARSRAAALSMVPTTTSAHELVGDVLPHLTGRIEARAIRVPTASVSAIDLTVRTRQDVTVDEARAVLNAAATGHVLGWTDEPLVSSDLRMRSESLVLSGPETSVSEGGLLRVFGWYDNEWGFSHRMLDVARMIAQDISA
ncbi:aldehyde dehydrogenase [Aliiroseovarius sp. Z3]|uniref:type I glyceraldehyde-3-phosphate dehydrogenase n=1 Tax=Aliiroseovarius sp. Z3 TaxID=2811402 RepID=UPI0023B2D6AE|nr:glyceraldehyde 3-phosphate dehydrogenase NAD-binding domain-containing protein [Aliiroseovarius sp. Z3]MDE9451658.1 aldehyde dehydrogenase [Aliiroseovarius sp. Z3]